jgi:hypothetical protein
LYAQLFEEWLIRITFFKHHFIFPFFELIHTT